MKYLIKFDESGRRQETYVVEEKTNEEIQSLLNSGFNLVDEANYQPLLGNVDGKEHIRNPHSGEYEEYVPLDPTAEEIAAKELEMAKAERAEAVSKITVEVDGMIFDGDEESQQRVARSIIALEDGETMPWVLYDNTIAEVTKEQLKKVLRLAGQKQSELWVLPYTSD